MCQKLKITIGLRPSGDRRTFGNAEEGILIGIGSNPIIKKFYRRLIA